MRLLNKIKTLKINKDGLHQNVPIMSSQITRVMWLGTKMVHGKAERIKVGII